MITIALFTYLVYSAAFYRGVIFFRTQSDCREVDKHIVGSLMAGSVLFVVFQTMVWLERPDKLFGIAHLDSLWVAFNFFNAFLYVTLANLLSKPRSCQTKAHQ